MRTLSPVYRWFFLIHSAVLLFAAASTAQVAIDRTCATCSRRQSDSLNLLVRNIRLNQVGYRPADPNKTALIADPSGTGFTVLDARTRAAVFSGTLKSIGSYTGGAMNIRGAYNSITDLYAFSRPARAENLYRADFSAFQAPGQYRIACGKDTSASFRIDPKVYNQILETSLKFFGSNRCGATHSWMHGACHLKDGDALGASFAGKLTGGWHDCGDHGKYSETVAYAAVTLSLTYALWPQKGEDFYGTSYDDTLPFGTDGIPDVLYEAKVGADYILNLYRASKANGLLEKGDMYHSVGMGPGMDHSYWDVPEKQDAQPVSKGGPARPVSAGIGSNVAGLYAASLALFAWGWEPFDPAYAKECLAAAADIYARIVTARRSTATAMPCCYPGAGQTKDDEGLAALALWFATKDARYKFDLLENPALGKNATAVFNQGEFPAGIMANSPFHHGGWTTDYENVHAFVLYGLAKLITESPGTAASYGLTPAVADSLRKDCIAALYNSIRIGSNGSGNPAPGIHADEPYHGVFTSVDWGFNRYNMGIVAELFMYWDLTGDRAYHDIGMDNLNYNLGMNPWDISFIMGTGEKNLQHPHNRAANPEGYNAGGLPYAYRSPKGALMGGCKPGATLIDDWELYTNTETCIDFSSQLLIPAQMLAMDLPEDKAGPKFRNVNAFPETESALVTWTTDELSRDTLYLLDAPGGKVLQVLPAADLSRDKRVDIKGLTPNTTYWFWLQGIDIRRNVSTDKNGGAFYTFTTQSSLPLAAITGVKVCNETHESALVTWWTRNGPYSSQVDYGKTKDLGSTRSPDDGGLPTLFHRVTLRDLEPATRYWFRVLSGAAKDDNGGNLYSLGTTQVLVDYTIRIKPTGKANKGQSAHFYVDVSNNENQAYQGLELRFYFSADAATAAALVAKGFDNQVFGVTGIPAALDIAYGAPKAVPGMDGIWYFPITLNSILPVAGRARFELQINSGSGGWGDFPFAGLKDAWSIRAHSRPADPVDFAGVDLSKGESGAYGGPEMIETVNGVKILSYVEDPYITAYYKGVHVFGHAPDGAADPLHVDRAVTLELTSPVASPEERLDLRRETGSVLLSGKASVSPDGRVDEVVVNGATLPESELKRDANGALTFSHQVVLAEGTNVFDIIAWDTVHCAVEARKLILNWKKGPALPPSQVARPTADPAGRAATDSIAVGLATETADAVIWYTLDGKAPSPGAAGSIRYLGPIVLKGPATVKAIAVRPEWLPSEIMTETYDIFAFPVVNIKSAGLADADADGFADGLVLMLDTLEARPLPAFAAEQMGACSMTSGFATTAAGAGAPRISGDTLRMPLRPNAIPVLAGKDTLAIPRPATDSTGMLRPGAYPLRDLVAPVLRRAVLRRGIRGAPDSLQIILSEPIRTAGLGRFAFPALRQADGSFYGITVEGVRKVDAVGVRDGETAYLFTVVSTPAAATGLATVPKAGDSLWLDPEAAVSDTLGNAQLNRANVRVPLRIHSPLAYTVEGVSPGGIANLPSIPQGPRWTVYAGPGAMGTIGQAPADLPLVPALPDRGRSGGLMVESTHPFKVHLGVYDNLGHFVTRVRLDIAPKDFATLEPGTTAGSRRLLLLWNGTADNGNTAATGAYVHAWKLTFFPTDGDPQSTEGKRIFGLLRSP
ncbi:MAG: glycoside hydrolase family 9 [Fibrobacteres bacterium]|nr:glycoside hydrolase family 9 [Fibrobacterota bacterium]